jgi:hypothetical protein
MHVERLVVRMGLTAEEQTVLLIWVVSLAGEQSQKHYLLACFLIRIAVARSSTFVLDRDDITRVE